MVSLVFCEVSFWAWGACQTGGFDFLACLVLDLFPAVRAWRHERVETGAGGGNHRLAHRGFFPVGAALLLPGDLIYVPLALLPRRSIFEPWSDPELFLPVGSGATGGLAVFFPDR